MDAFLCRISYIYISLCLCSFSFAQSHIDETHLNIVSRICFIFSVFLVLSMKTKQKNERVVWDKNSLLFVSFIVIWRIGKRCLRAFFSPIAVVIASMGRQKTKPAILRNNSSEKIVPIEWKWPFFSRFCFFIYCIFAMQIFDSILFSPPRKKKRITTWILAHASHPLCRTLGFLCLMLSINHGIFIGKQKTEQFRNLTEFPENCPHKAQKKTDKIFHNCRRNIFMHQ